MNMMNTTKNEYPGFTFFWLLHADNEEFSNWYASEFVIDDFCYFSVEQYMMAQKARLFHDARHYTQILRAHSSKECKALGKLVTNFDPQTWDDNKYEIVKTANRAKFAQNPELLSKLLATGDTIMAEANPDDRIWGIALEAHEGAQTAPDQWPGQNLLGQILMELRDEFRNGQKR